MVETRRSSSCSSNKRPSSSSPPPSSTKNSKRSKAAAVDKEAEVEKKELPPPANFIEERTTVADLPKDANASGAAEEKQNGVGGTSFSAAGQVAKMMSPTSLPMSKKQHVMKPPRTLRLPWGKLISQCSQNPHLPIYGQEFTVGQSRGCDLRLRDPSVSNLLCKLKHEEQGGAFVVLLEILGGKGGVQVNGKTIEKNSNVVLTAGDEVIFNSSGKHAYIFQQLSSTATPILPSHNISIAEGLSVKGIHFRTRPVDPTVDDEASTLASFSNNSKGLSIGDLQNGSPSPDLDLNGSLYKMFEDQRAVLKDNGSLSTLASTRSQAFKDSLKKGILNPTDIDVSFESFPYYLCENTKTVLLSCAYVHLECKMKVAQEISSLSQHTLVSGPAGSEIYQETLAKALAKHFDARLLIIDSLLLPANPSSKDSESLKESTKGEKSWFFAKQRATLVDTLRKRPVSSVEADIVDTSNSQSLPKQEASTATSKAYMFKKGDRVKYVGSLHSTGNPFLSQKGPNYGYRGKVVLVFEENGLSKIGVRFDKQIPEGNDLGGLCEGDHGFFCSADLLRPDYPGFEDTERFAINELIEVVSEEIKGGSLVIFLKDIEKSMIGSTESLTLKSKLDSLPAGVLVIGSHTQADNRKEKSHPGGLLFTKFGSNQALLDFTFPDGLSRLHERSKESPKGMKHLTRLFPNKVTIHLPQDEAQLVDWKTHLDRDVETLKAKTNFLNIQSFLDRTGLVCNDLETICIKDPTLTNESIDKIVGFAVSHHLKGKKNEKLPKDSKLVLSSER